MELLDSKLDLRNSYSKMIKSAHSNFLKNQKSILKNIIPNDKVDSDDPYYADRLKNMDNHMINTQILEISKFKYKYIIKDILQWLVIHSEDFVKKNTPKFINEFKASKEDKFLKQIDLKVVNLDISFVNVLKSMRSVLDLEYRYVVKVGDNHILTIDDKYKIKDGMFLVNFPSWLFFTKNKLEKKVESTSKSLKDYNTHLQNYQCRVLTLMDMYTKLFKDFHLFVSNTEYDMDKYILSSALYREPNEITDNRRRVEVCRVFINDYYNLVSQLYLYFHIVTDYYYASLEKIKNLYEENR